MDSSLPSYSEATSEVDWLLLVAPFVPASSWTACCLINRRFYRHFAPRLWQDPLVTIRQLGLRPNDGELPFSSVTRLYFSPARRMVKALDFRAFALTASGLYSTEASERAISQSFRVVPQLFPGLTCLLMDGHPELDPGSLAATAAASGSCSLQLLDLAHCRQELSAKLFLPQLFRGLVYLDVSHVPGSLRSAIQSSLNPTYLPELRILKARGREVDDATAHLLFQTFRLQLWSLDLSDNMLTDRAVDGLLAHCFSSVSFRSDAHFEIEGKLVHPRNLGNHSYGPFEFVQESAHSASFSHPNRYFADAPVYSLRADQTDLQEWQTIRSDGAAPLRHDDSGTVKEMLLAGDISTTTRSPLDRMVRDLQTSRGGITHLYLNGNRFTVNGIGRLLRLSLGRLEHFECDHCLLPSPDQALRDKRQLIGVEGIGGLSHLFRPVWSSNLRSIRAHHSLVTQGPELFTESLSPAKALRVSEIVVSKNMGRIYPQAFTPDMNPRIASITLTNIPARSTGVVIERLNAFLLLASSQRQMINRIKSTMGDRHPTILPGLRHIRLELDSDFPEDDVGSYTGHEVDYDRLLDPGNQDFSSDTFSFFDNERPNRAESARQRASACPSPAELRDYSHWTSGRLKSRPYSDTESEFIAYHEEASTSWTGNVFSVPVWIGTGTLGPYPAVNEYMWNVQDPALRADVGPAMPVHVAAGVPALSYIFYAAWDAILFPRNLATAVMSSGSKSLRDVAAAIKEYRARTKGTPDHWDGKIELVRTSRPSRYLVSEYRR
ncbi:hypothetical protein F5Y17DRAFT_470152 [Xylariaceae sp. FL0594]|nr:hypothetical protein F5Y17DRAFT_470152 [Xylariaceae sp. FL0594]